MLSAYFWLPAIVEKEFISLSQTPLANKQEHFLSISELIYSPWSLVKTKPPVQLGVLPVILLVITVLLIFTKQQTKRRVIGFGAVGLILTIFFMLPASLPLWNLPILSDVDFPWRYMAVTIFLGSFITGSIGNLKYGKWLSLIIVGLLVYIGFSYIQTSKSVVKSDEYYETNDATTTSRDELMPVWVGSFPKNRPEELAYFQNTQSSFVTTLLNNSKETQFKTNSDTAQVLAVNTVYFPGWKSYIDNIGVGLGKDSLGLMNIAVPQGEHIVKLKFEKTPVRSFADIVSMFAAASLIGLCILSKKTSLFY